MWEDQCLVQEFWDSQRLNHHYFINKMILLCVRIFQCQLAKGDSIFLLLTVDYW